MPEIKTTTIECDVCGKEMWRDAHYEGPGTPLELRAKTEEPSAWFGTDYVCGPVCAMTLCRDEVVRVFGEEDAVKSA